MSDLKLIKTTKNNYLAPCFENGEFSDEGEYIEAPYFVRQDYELFLNNELIGKANVIEIKFSAMVNTQEDIYDTFDNYSYITSDLGHEIIDQDANDLKDILYENVDELFSGDLIYIEELTIIEKYRNNKLGTNLLLNIINDYIGNHFLIIIKPFPIGQMDLDQFIIMQNKLKVLYGKIGFREIDGITDYKFMQKLTS